MMKLKPFKLERYFAEYEFSVQYLLSSSDCDGLQQSELLQMADDQTRSLWENLTLGYTESLGHPLLREEIARLYRGTTPDDCLVIVPEEGIYIAISSILEEGDHVICTFPGYQSFRCTRLPKGWAARSQNGSRRRQMVGASTRIFWSSKFSPTPDC
jgi:DNA-binding transcriptional MocR family regulator